MVDQLSRNELIYEANSLTRTLSRLQKRYQQKPSSVDLDQLYNAQTRLKKLRQLINAS